MNNYIFIFIINVNVFYLNGKSHSAEKREVGL